MIVYIKIDTDDNIDIVSCSDAWLDFCQSWTDKIEQEADLKWYLQLDSTLPLEEFAVQFEQKLTFTNSTGIWGAGISKVVAELVAKANSFSPNKLPIVFPNQTDKFLARLPIELLPLSNDIISFKKLGIATFGELKKIPLSELAKQFGDNGNLIYNFISGIDPHPLQCQTFQIISWEINFLTLPEYQAKVAPPLLVNHLEVGVRSICDQLHAVNRLAEQVELYWYCDEQRCSKVKTLYSPTDKSDQLLRFLRSSLPQTAVSILGIRVKRLKAHSATQLSIFGSNSGNKLKVTQVSEELKVRFGDEALTSISISRREKILAMWEEKYL